MKPSRLFWVVILVALFGFVAKADSTSDPKIILQLTGGSGSPVCSSSTCDLGTVTYSNLNGFSGDIDTTQRVTTLDFGVTGSPLPPEDFTCESIYFAECEVTEESDPNHTYDLEVTFDCMCTSASSCGLPPGDWHFEVTVPSVPEPSTVGLLLCGLVPLFLMGRKRWANLRAV